MAPPSASGMAPKPAASKHQGPKTAQRRRIEPAIPYSLMRPRPKSIVMSQEVPAPTSPPVEPPTSIAAKLETLNLGISGSETTQVVTPTTSEANSGSTHSRPSTRGKQDDKIEEHVSQQQVDALSAVEDRTKSSLSDDSSTKSDANTDAARPAVDTTTSLDTSDVLVEENKLPAVPQVDGAERSSQAPLASTDGISPFVNGVSQPTQLSHPSAPPPGYAQHPPQHQHHPSNASIVMNGSHNPIGVHSPQPGTMFQPPPPLVAPPTQRYSHAHTPSGILDPRGMPFFPNALNGFQASPMSQGHPSAHQRNSSRIPGDGRLGHSHHNSYSPAERTGTPPYLRHPADSAPASDQPYSNGQTFSEMASNWYSDRTFADCMICLDIPDTLMRSNSTTPGVRQGPLHFAAHRVVLGSNHVLRQIMLERGEAGANREVHIRPHDDFARADGFQAAIQYLYGRQSKIMLPPRLQHAAPIELVYFDLGVAAAGAFLQEPHLSLSGLCSAGEAVRSWDVAELALNFCLSGASLLPQHPNRPDLLFPEIGYRHGTFVDRLVRPSIAFVVEKFPLGFVLDTSVADVVYSRHPAVQNTSVNTQEKRSKSSGGSVTSIRFGDLGTNDSEGIQAQSCEAVLSRILLNLPTVMLKYVLETNRLGAASRHMTAHARAQISNEIVAERERRRQAAVERCLSDGSLATAPGALSSQEPQILPQGWDLCWKEEVVQHQDTIAIVRSWVPLQR